MSWVGFCRVHLGVFVLTEWMKAELKASFINSWTLQIRFNKEVPVELFHQCCFWKKYSNWVNSNALTKVILILQSSESEDVFEDYAPSGKSVVSSDCVHPVVLKWKGGGEEVYVSGSYDRWQTRVKLHKRSVESF
jgi:Glycogen recognition site of AMP-activated protein kinase